MIQTLPNHCRHPCAVNDSARPKPATKRALVGSMTKSEKSPKSNSGSASGSLRFVAGFGRAMSLVGERMQALLRGESDAAAA